MNGEPIQCAGCLGWFEAGELYIFAGRRETEKGRCYRCLPDDLRELADFAGRMTLTERIEAGQLIAEAEAQL